jgi:hypothetical protein
MAMTANKAADTRRLAEARRAELDCDASRGGLGTSGNKRGFQEK